jgi:hypothetical protein
LKSSAMMTPASCLPPMWTAIQNQASTRI